MVLESLLDPLDSERRLLKVFFLGVLYASIAVIFSLWIFKSQASIIMISLTVFASIPLVYKAIKLEEKKDTYIKKEGLLMKEHFKVLSMFLCLFLGFVIAFSVWYVILPESSLDYLFSTQTNTIRSINQVTGNAVDSGMFVKIFFNNFNVLLFCILFSFFYGAGAIFILTWNASVIAAAVGNFVKMNIGRYAAEIGFTSIAGYFHIMSLGLLRYLTHGIFEMFGFFVGGLAGGIISVAVIRHDLFSKSFKHIVIDSFYLVVLSVGMLFFAALVEVFVTPILF